MSELGPVRVVVVRADLETRVYEAAEVWQVITGLLEHSDHVEVQVSDGRRVANAAAADGRAAAVGWRPLRPLTLAADAVHVFGPIPGSVRLLLLAMCCRLRGTPVVFTPMSLLSDDFARASWYRQRGRLQRRVRSLLVRWLRSAWGLLSSASLVSGEHERATTPLNPSPTALLPWPLPDTPLITAAAASHTAAVAGDGPIALVSRPDPWRKGFDRVSRWLRAGPAALVQPALIVFTADEPQAREQLSRPEAEGLLIWDRTTRGADLADALSGCRGVVLLSRWEGQPRALREATLLGLPTLSSPEAQFAEVVAHVGAGAVVDGDDPDAVQAAFEALPGHRVDVAAARDLFDPAHIGAFLVDLYRDVLAGIDVDGRSYYEARRTAREAGASR